MSFTRYKKYYISNKDGVLMPMVYESPTGEIKYYTSNEEIRGYIPNEEITQAVRSPMGRRYTKFFLLHDDETIKEEITQNVLTSGSIEKKNSSGQSRSCNLSLVNEKIKVLVGFKGKNTPIYEYILRRRMLHCTMLLRQGMRVEDAAHSAGFVNMASFTKLFHMFVTNFHCFVDLFCRIACFLFAADA
jgi:AraC-like DNA-binding protein